MPLGLALIAGGLSTLNPCGFALLPALLSFYVGARDEDLPPASTRLWQALLVGAFVSVGFLVVFAAVGLPVSLGARSLTRAVPLAGIVLGAVMAVVGIAVLLGLQLSLPVRHSLRAPQGRGPGALLLFGAGYGIASLGCTLPVFVAVVGASLASSGPLAGVATFGAYALGMAIVIVALSLGAATLRTGLATRLRALVPHTSRIGGALVAVAGAYLAYFWWRARFGDAARLGDDPLVGIVLSFTDAVQSVAASGGGRWILIAAAGVVAGAAGAALLRPGPTQDP